MKRTIAGTVASVLFLFTLSASAETVLHCGPSMQLQQGSGTVKVCTIQKGDSLSALLAQVSVSAVRQSNR